MYGSLGKYIAFFCIHLIICASSYCLEEPLQKPISVTAGEELELSAPLHIPDKFRASFKLYMESLKVASPLPFPFTLEKYLLTNDSITISGRCLVGGMYEIPLGIFCYENDFLVLPSWRVTVNEIPPFVLRPKDLLFPYPEKMLLVSSYNTHLQSSLDEEMLMAFSSRLSCENFLWHTFLVSFFLLITAYPILKIFFMFSAHRKAGQSSRILSPKERFFALQRAYNLGDISWTKLVHFLNEIISPTESKTSYELEVACRDLNEKDLEKACEIIEEKGYIPGTEEEMRKVYTLLENRFKPS
jgi:hypothetical protein